MGLTYQMKMKIHFDMADKNSVLSASLIFSFATILEKFSSIPGGHLTQVCGSRIDEGQKSYLHGVRPRLLRGGQGEKKINKTGIFRLYRHDDGSTQGIRNRDKQKIRYKKEAA